MKTFFILVSLVVVGCFATESDHHSHGHKDESANKTTTTTTTTIAPTVTPTSTSLEMSLEEVHKSSTKSSESMKSSEGSTLRDLLNTRQRRSINVNQQLDLGMPKVSTNPSNSHARIRMQRVPNMMMIRGNMRQRTRREVLEEKSVEKKNETIEAVDKKNETVDKKNETVDKKNETVEAVDKKNEAIEAVEKKLEPIESSAIPAKKPESDNSTKILDVPLTEEKATKLPKDDKIEEKVVEKKPEEKLTDKLPADDKTDERVVDKLAEKTVEEKKTGEIAPKIHSHDKTDPKHAPEDCDKELAKYPKRKPEVKIFRFKEKIGDDKGQLEPHEPEGKIDVFTALMKDPADPEDTPRVKGQMDMLREPETFTEEEINAFNNNAGNPGLAGGRSIKKRSTDYGATEEIRLVKSTPRRAPLRSSEYQESAPLRSSEIRYAVRHAKPAARVVKSRAPLRSSTYYDEPAPAPVVVPTVLETYETPAPVVVPTVLETYENPQPAPVVQPTVLETYEKPPPAPVVVPTVLETYEKPQPAPVVTAVIESYDQEEVAPIRSAPRRIQHAPARSAPRPIDFEEQAPVRSAPRRVQHAPVRSAPRPVAHAPLRSAPRPVEFVEAPLRSAPRPRVRVAAPRVRTQSYSLFDEVAAKPEALSDDGYTSSTFDIPADEYSMVAPIRISSNRYRRSAGSSSLSQTRRNLKSGHPKTKVAVAAPVVLKSSEYTGTEKSAEHSEILVAKTIAPMSSFKSFKLKQNGGQKRNRRSVNKHNKVRAVEIVDGIVKSPEYVETAPVAVVRSSRYSSSRIRTNKRLRRSFDDNSTTLTLMQKRTPPMKPVSAIVPPTKANKKKDEPLDDKLSVM